jgi:hypothetical protein
MTEFTVDFIVKEPDELLWRMVLVEEGPWPSKDTEGNPRRIQGRLYHCLDVALDGGLWRLYPDSYGKLVVVQLDCYNIPERDVREFFEQFSAGALSAPDYAAALKSTPYLSGLSFELNCATAG